MGLAQKKLPPGKIEQNDFENSKGFTINTVCKELSVEGQQKTGRVRMIQHCQ
jgi:hypothetical protein